MKPDWIEPEWGWRIPDAVGSVFLDKRSGLLVEVVEERMETLYEGEYSHDHEPLDERYWSYRIVYFDDRTDPGNGLWRAPEDLKPLSDMEVIARSAL